MDPISAEHGTRRRLGDMAGLLAAAKRGDARETERLIKAGSRLRVTDDDGANALHLAAFNGHPDTTQVLVELGASIESKTTRGETPLLLAASQGRAEVAQVLLNAGARVDAVDALGNTAAHFAAKNNHVRVLEVRNCHPPTPPLRHPGPRAMPHLCAIVSSPKALVEGKAPLQARNNRDGMMPLHLASIYGKAETAELLARSGAPLKARTKSGRTPVDLARQEKFKQVENAIEFHANRRLLAEGSSSPGDDDDDSGPHAPDPREAYAAGFDPRTPYMVSNGQEELLLPTLAMGGAALLLPYLFYRLLVSLHQRGAAKMRGHGVA